MGENSKCFQSNIIISSLDNNYYESIRCYEYFCSDDNKIAVKIGNEIIWCENENEIIELDNIIFEGNSYSGSIKCPKKFERFCNYPKLCANKC